MRFNHFHHSITRRFALAFGVMLLVSPMVHAQLEFQNPQFPGTQFPNQFPNPQFPNQFQNPQFPGGQFPINPAIPQGSVQTPATPSLGVFGNFTPRGMLVQRVVAGSPADQGGVKMGDVIMKLDNVNVTNQAVFNQALATAGGSVQVVLSRGFGQQPIRINIDLSGGGRGRVRAPFYFGVQGTFQFRGGMFVKKVYDNTPALQVGVKQGDMIVAVNQRPIATEQDYWRALMDSGGDAEFTIRRGGRLNQIKAKLKLFTFGTLGDYLPAGARFEVVGPETPAAIAGLRPGDMGMSMDGKAIRNQQEFNQAMKQSGGSVVLQLRRGLGGIGQIKMDVINNALGCWCEETKGGMRVLTVLQGSLAQRIGLQRGDTIVQIDRRRTRTLPQLEASLNNARNLMVLDYHSNTFGQLVRRNVDLTR